MVGGEVAHVIEENAEPPAVGAEVPVVIDLERRLYNMLHHALAALISKDLEIHTSPIDKSGS